MRRGQKARVRTRNTWNRELFIRVLRQNPPSAFHAGRLFNEVMVNTGSIRIPSAWVTLTYLVRNSLSFFRFSFSLSLVRSLWGLFVTLFYWFSLSSLLFSFISYLFSLSSVFSSLLFPFSLLSLSPSYLLSFLPPNLSWSRQREERSLYPPPLRNKIHESRNCIK